jgi:hypothetical protein
LGAVRRLVQAPEGLKEAHKMLGFSPGHAALLALVSFMVTAIKIRAVAALGST